MRSDLIRSDRIRYRKKERKKERTKERKNERTKERKNERTKERKKERKKKERKKQTNKHHSQSQVLENMDSARRQWDSNFWHQTKLVHNKNIDPKVAKESVFLFVKNIDPQLKLIHIVVLILDSDNNCFCRCLYLFVFFFFADQTRLRISLEEGFVDKTGVHPLTTGQCFLAAFVVGRIYFQWRLYAYTICYREFII